MRKILTRVFSGVCALALAGGVALGIFDATASEQEQTSFFYASQNAEVVTQYQAPAHIGDYKGVFVKAKDNGDSGVTLNHELDLRAFTADDILVTLLPITTEPKQTVGDLELSKITVRLTDVEDENCFVEMSVQRNMEDAYPYAGYASAYGSGQVSTGRYFNDDGTIRYFSANNYGRQVYANFYGRTRTGVSLERDIKPVTFAYDYDTSCVHTDASVPHAEKDTVIADLKDSANMKGDWTGFKSGKVKMTIIASSENFANQNAGFMILNFGGLDLSKESWTDSEAPFFKIDTLGYTVEDLPQAEVFSPYPVYQAIAFDRFDGVYGLGTAERELNITVRKAGSTVPVSVTNGYFLPTETGVYEICYSATDTTGNRAECVLRVQAYNVSEITHAWVLPLEKTATVGVKAVIPAHEVAGVYGNYTLTTTVTERTTGAEIAIQNGGFIAEREGVYEISVTVQDFLGRTAIFPYAVTAKAKKTPILDTTPTIPRLMLLDKELTLPDFEAYDYYSLTGKKMQAEKYYLFKNTDGTVLKKVKPNEKFTLDKSFGESIIVEYVAKSVVYEEKVNDSVAVTLLDKSGTVDFSKYFIAENTTGVEGNYTGDSCIAYLFNTNDARVAYGLPLPFNGMEFAFRVPSEANNYDTIHIALIDGAYANKRVELAVKDSDDANFSDFYLNGEKVGKIYGTFDDTKIEDFLFRINGRNEIVDESGNLVCQVTHYASGEPFVGFSDNVCYAEFSFANVTGESAIQFVKNGRQYFDALTNADYIEPLIVTCGEYRFEQGVGEITLPGAVAIDAICGRTDVFVEVYTESEDLVYSTKVGTDAIRFVLKNSGKYTVKYVSEDDFYNVGVNESILSVYREQPFELSILGNVPETAKKGNVVKLPSFAVDTDLVSYESLVFVLMPKGGKIELDESLSFKVEQEGLYKVYYYVVYEVENSYLYQLAEYYIEVK